MLYNKHLNLNFDPIEELPSVCLPNLNKPHMWTYFNEKEIKLSKELKQFLDRHDLRMAICTIFYTPPNNFLFTHIDGDGPIYYMKDICSLNWVWGSTEHKMSWYHIKDEFIDKLDVYKEQVIEADENNKDVIPWYYLNFSTMPEDQIYEVESVKVGYPTMVQTGTPHRVENHSKLTGRWCFGMSFYKKDNDKDLLTFREAETIFKEYIKNSP